MTSPPQTSLSLVGVAAAAVAALALAAPGAVALGASKPEPKPNPGELWKQYPLAPKQGRRSAKPAPPRLPAPAPKSEQSSSESQPRAAAGRADSEDARAEIARVLFVVALASGAVSVLLLLGLAWGRREALSSLHLPSVHLPSVHFPRPPPLRRAVAPVGRSFGHAGESLGHAAGSVGHAAGSVGHAARSLVRFVGEVAPSRHSHRGYTRSDSDAGGLLGGGRREWLRTTVWYLASALVSIGAAFLVISLLN